MHLGNKKSGFYIAAKIQVGQLSSYLMDVENAIEAQEVKVPEQFAKKPETEKPTSNTSVADELKKLKELLDAARLRRDVKINSAKKKLLGETKNSRNLVLFKIFNQPISLRRGICPAFLLLIN